MELRNRTEAKDLLQKVRRLLSNGVLKTWASTRLWPSRGADNIVSRRVMDRPGMKYVKMSYYFQAEVIYYAIYREE
jgi:hypothetical protein